MATKEATKETGDTSRPKLTATSRAFTKIRRPFPPGVHSANWNDVNYELREKLAQAIVEKRFPVLLFGPPGRGKSCALACLFVSYMVMRNALHGTGREPKWIQLDDFCRQVISARTSKTGTVEVNRLNEAYTKHSDFVTEAQLFNRITQAPVLFCDDIGLREQTQSMLEITYKLVNWRTPQEPTFYSSNLSPEQLKETFDSRIVSRMCQGTIIKLGGDDRRLANASYQEIF